MISLQALLASGIYTKLPTYVLIGVGALLAIAFLIGSAKGFRRVGKGAFGWVVAGVAFILLYKFLANKSPFSVTAGKNATDITGIVWAFLMVIACILATLLLYGIVVVVFCPAPKKSSRNQRFELEFDDDDDEYDEFSFSKSKTRSGQFIRTKYKPGLVSRFAGAIVCTLGVAGVLASILAVFLLVVNCTKLSQGSMGAMLEVRWVKGALKYASNYALDFITIGIIFWIAYKGFKTGLLGLTGKVIRRIGVLVALVAGFALPFLNFAETVGILKTVVSRCSALFAGMSSELLRGILGKLAAGAVVAAVGVIAVLLLSLLFSALSSSVKKAKPIALVDQVLASLIYIVLGLLICFVFWGILYILDACNIFYVSKVFSEGASLSKECFATANKLLGSFVEKYLLRFAA